MYTIVHYVHCKYTCIILCAEFFCRSPYQSCIHMYNVYGSTLCGISFHVRVWWIQSFVQVLEVSDSSVCAYLDGFSVCVRPGDRYKALQMLSCTTVDMVYIYKFMYTCTIQALLVLQLCNYILGMLQGVTLYMCIVCMHNVLCMCTYHSTMKPSIWPL